MPYGERKVAGKLMIENIFKDEFGISLQTFEARNNKNEEQVSAEINLDRIDEIFRTDGNKSLYSNDSIRRTIKKAYDNNEKLKKSEKSIEAKFWNSERKALAIDKIKNSYESLRKIKELKK